EAGHALFSPPRMWLAVGADRFFPRQVSGETHFLKPWLAALPAEFRNHAASGHHGIGNAVFQIDLAVAVAIDAAFQIILWQKLHHADFASPSASGRRINDALIEELEKSD